MNKACLHQSNTCNDILTLRKTLLMMSVILNKKRKDKGKKMNYTFKS